MKKTLLLLSLSLCAAGAFAQDYIPFPTSGAVWTQRFGNNERPLLECYKVENEDLTVDGNTYHKLYKSGTTSFATSEVVGGLREDSKRIYFYDLKAGKERMLYDFNLKPGDVITGSKTGATATLDYIDLVSIDGVDHRKFNFSVGSGTVVSSAYWIEGVGNGAKGGLLESFLNQPTCDCFYDIICYQQGGSWAFHNAYQGSTDCDGIGLGINDVKATKSAISLYPNPVTGVSTIHIAGTAAQQVAIYSTTGALVKTYPVVNGQDISLNKAEFAAGLYTYRVSAASGEALQKGLFEVHN